MAQEDPLKEALSMLATEQLEALKTALGQSSSAGHPKALSEQQIETLRSEAANYHLAQRRAVEAVGVLWNARLDLAIDSGDVAHIDSVMARPVAIYDNCNCLSEANE